MINLRLLKYTISSLNFQLFVQQLIISTQINLEKLRKLSLASAMSFLVLKNIFFQVARKDSSKIEFQYVSIFMQEISLDTRNFSVLIK